MSNDNYGSDAYYSYGGSHNLQQRSGSEYYTYGQEQIQQYPQQMGPAVGEAPDLPPLLNHSNWQVDVSYDEMYNSNQDMGAWYGPSQQQQSFGVQNPTSATYTSHNLVNQGFANQSNTFTLDNVTDQFVTDFLNESTPLLPPPQQQQNWGQNYDRPTNNNYFFPLDDGYHHQDTRSEPNPYVSSYPYDQNQQSIPPQTYHDQSNSQTNLNYLVSPIPGHVSEAAALPDVTTPQSHISSSLKDLSPSISSLSNSNLANDATSLIIEVNAFKCKICCFISLDKSEVLSHVNTTHTESFGQVLNKTHVSQPSVQILQSSMNEGAAKSNSLPSQVNPGMAIICPKCSSAFTSSNSFDEHICSDPSASAATLVSDISEPLSTVNGADQSSVKSQNTSSVPKSLKLVPKVMPIILKAKETKTTSPSSNNNPSSSSSSNAQSNNYLSVNNANHQPKVALKSAVCTQGTQEHDPSQVGSALEAKAALITNDLKPAKKKKKKTKGVKKENSSLFPCERKKCPAKYVLKDNLERHDTFHVHGDELKFKCTYCDKHTSTNWQTTAGHLWREHRVDLELHKCDMCAYRSYSLSILQNIHKKIHSNEKNYLCDVCEKRFKNYKQMVNHKARHMRAENAVSQKGGEKAQCEVCGKGFPELRMLKIHINSVHEKKDFTNYVCVTCGHQATSKGALKTHVRSHTGEKPFKCLACEYSTADHNSFRRHKMRHSGEKPYKCPFCDYACIQHFRVKHPDKAHGVVFMCDCGFKSINEEVYKAHLRDQHKLEQDSDSHPRTAKRHRSDGESESNSSAPSTPALNAPESPDMPVLMNPQSKQDIRCTSRPASSSISSSGDDDSSQGSTTDSDPKSVAMVNFPLNGNHVLNTQVNHVTDIVEEAFGAFLTD